jgi:hypothetical protein
MPEPSTNAGPGLTRKEDGLYCEGQSLAYRITGLLPYNLDRLRITLKAAALPGSGESGCPAFHIDTFDLYNSHGREIYAEACAKYFVAPV